TGTGCVSSIINGRFLAKSAKNYRQEREGCASPAEPIAVPGIEGLVLAIGEGELSGGLSEWRQSAHHATGGIDRGGHAVIGGAHDPSRVFGGAHADYQEMLLTRGDAAAEVAVIGKIEQNLGAVLNETAGQGRE